MLINACSFNVSKKIIINICIRLSILASNISLETTFQPVNQSPYPYNDNQDSS